MQRRLALGLIVASTLTATACGANAVPSDEVAAAGPSTKAAGTARVETVTRVSVIGSAAETFQFRSTGVVDYANDRREDREESSGCRTITIGDVTYGELSSDGGFPAGKHWVKSGGEAIDDETLFEQSEEESTTSADGSITTWSTAVGFATPEPAPDDYLDYLRESSGEPERVGREDVRGVPTTHYRGQLDVRHRIEAELETAGWKAANIERYLEDIHGTREIDVWVDSAGLARRIVATDASPGAEAGMAGDWVTTTEYFDFGLETDIQPPPADEVIDGDEWQRITAKAMRTWLEEQSSVVDEGSQPLPGAFEPPTLSGADSPPTSCLH